MNYQQMAMLGSIIYFGLAVSSLFVATIFQKFRAKYVIANFMMVNAVACFIFSFSSNWILLYSMRLVLGFSQAFCIIYGPVWVNEFSPQDSTTSWMAFLHSFVIIGVLIGYIVTAIFVSSLSHIVGWREAFMLQGFAMIIISCCFYCTDNKVVDVLASEGKEGLRDRMRSFSDVHNLAPPQQPPRNRKISERAQSQAGAADNLPASTSHFETTRRVRIDSITLNNNELNHFL